MAKILQTKSQEVCLPSAWTPVLCRSQVISNACTGSGLQHPGVACQELALLGKEGAGDGRNLRNRNQMANHNCPLNVGTEIMAVEVVC